MQLDHEQWVLIYPWVLIFCLELSLVQKAIWIKIICADINKFRCIRWRINIKNKTNALCPQWLWCQENIKILMFFYITKLQNTCIVYKTLSLQLLEHGENDIQPDTTSWIYANIGQYFRGCDIILLRKSKRLDNWDGLGFWGIKKKEWIDFYHCRVVVSTHC